MNYYEHLKFAFSFAQFKNLPTSTRITHLAILYKWNAFRSPASFSLSDRELQSLTGLGSNAVTSAKRQLKNLGFIDFKATKAGTLYFLPQGENARFERQVNAPAEAKTLHSAVIPATKSNTKNTTTKTAREGTKILSFKPRNLSQRLENRKRLKIMPLRLFLLNNKFAFDIISENLVKEIFL